MDRELPASLLANQRECVGGAEGRGLGGARAGMGLFEQVSVT